MKNIGKRIKDLRKKNDLTQEKLADLLGVTYKSVSKWECGLTTPDLAMIVPLARVLHVSADELLGMKPTEQDERKAYFDSEYVKHWNEHWQEGDLEAVYLLAKQAVKEFPEEYKYWHWLDTVEYYLSFDQKPEEFMEWIDNSIKHNLIAFENGDSEDCKDCALWDIICAYRYSNRIEEAKKYAELFPEIFTTRDDALALCLEGKELLTHQQKMLHNTLAKLCCILYEMYRYGDASDQRVRACVEAEKKIIDAIIPDGEPLHFNSHLSDIHEKLADIALVSQDYTTAVNELEKAKEFAAAFDKAMISGKQYYTCLLLDHCNYEYYRPLESGYWEKALLDRLSTDSKYAVLRDRDDFKTLFV